MTSGRPQVRTHSHVMPSHACRHGLNVVSHGLRRALNTSLGASLVPVLQ